MIMKSYAEAVVGPNKEDQEVFTRLYEMGFSQEKAKQSATRFRVRITHKKSKRTKVVEIREGMKIPVRGSIENYSIENLGIAEVGGLR
jgi:hypothetical protein